MRTEIHPTYDITTVTCSCGSQFVTRTTRPPAMTVELCNECHPFYTGEQRLVDSGGRVEHFQRRYGQAADIRSKRFHKRNAPPTSESAVAGKPGAGKS